MGEIYNTQDIRPAVATQIKQHRLSAGLTATQLADAVDVSVPLVSQWEGGAKMPSPVLLVKLAQVFGCTTDELLGLRREEVENRAGDETDPRAV